MHKQRNGSSSGVALRMERGICNSSFGELVQQMHQLISSTDGAALSLHSHTFGAGHTGVGASRGRWAPQPRWAWVAVLPKPAGVRSPRGASPQAPPMVPAQAKQGGGRWHGLWLGGNALGSPGRVCGAGTLSRAPACHPEGTVPWAWPEAR